MTDQPDNPGVERPSDEDTAAVVGKMMGWETTNHINQYNEDRGWYYDPETGDQEYRHPIYHNGKRDTAGYLNEWMFDPREDTDSAMRLLKFLIGNNSGSYDSSGFFFGRYGTVPICGGSAFRYAVVALTVRVMGVGTGTVR